MLVAGLPTSTKEQTISPSISSSNTKNPDLFQNKNTEPSKAEVERPLKYSIAKRFRHKIMQLGSALLLKKGPLISERMMGKEELLTIKNI